MVIEVETLPSSMPLKRRSMSSIESMATPTRPTSPRAGAVGVVAHLRRQIERGREPRLARLEQVVKPLVGLFGGPESRVLPHGPEAAAVHRRLHPARER